MNSIYLNLYDLGDCTDISAHALGLGFYHCAIQAHSAEYGYVDDENTMIIYLDIIIFCMILSIEKETNLHFLDMTICFS